VAAAEGDTRGARLLRRFGPPALLLSWVPVLGDALVALAVAARLPFGAFSIWTAVGKGLRYLAVAWAASAAF
jgi:membrane protein YqaA with SNARE-associated domain